MRDFEYTTRRPSPELGGSTHSGGRVVVVGGGGSVSVTWAAVPRDGVIRAGVGGSSITSGAGSVVVGGTVVVVVVVVLLEAGGAGSLVSGAGSLVGGGVDVVVVGPVPAPAVVALATTSVVPATESVTIRPNFDRIGTRLSGRSGPVEWNLDQRTSMHRQVTGAT